MGSHGLRFEVELPRDQIAALLHQTADGLAAGTLQLGGAAHDLDGLRELNLALELRGADVRLRVKGKPDPRARARDDHGAYRALKKDMQRTWHELRRCARARALPAPAAVLRLVEQGQAMLQHTDRGAEFHQAFASRLQALQRAADGTDVDAWCTAVAQVDALRKAAHRRYR